MAKKTGVIVDGPGDYSALKTRFQSGYHILKCDGPRGHCARSEDICAKAGKQVRMLFGLGCSRVIVLLDLETRPVGPEAFIATMNDLLKGSYGEKVSCQVANQMIENWLLADVAYLSRHKKFLRRIAHQKNYEGLHGKNELKKLVKRGVSYNEISHGSQLFKLLRFANAAALSPSFDGFLAASGATP